MEERDAISLSEKGDLI